MDIYEQLDRDREAWKPQPGDVLVGEVVEIDVRDGGYGDYLTVTVATEDGREVTFHGFHSVAKRELAKVRPEVGSKIGIKYQDRSTGTARSYERYKIVTESVQGPRVPDWAAIARQAESEVDETESQPAPTANDDGPPPF